MVHVLASYSVGYTGWRTGLRGEIDKAGKTRFPSVLQSSIRSVARISRVGRAPRIW